MENANVVIWNRHALHMSFVAEVGPLQRKVDTKEGTVFNFENFLKFRWLIFLFNSPDQNLIRNSSYIVAYRRPTLIHSFRLRNTPDCLPSYLRKNRFLPQNNVSFLCCSFTTFSNDKQTMALKGNRPRSKSQRACGTEGVNWYEKRGSNERQYI